MKIRPMPFLALLLGMLAAHGALASGPYQITGTATSRDGDLVRTEYTVRAGSHPLDRFKMVRLAKGDAAARELRGSILLLPPLGPPLGLRGAADLRLGDADLQPLNLEGLWRDLP